MSTLERRPFAAAATTAFFADTSFAISCCSASLIRAASALSGLIETFSASSPPAGAWLACWAIATEKPVDGFQARRRHARVALIDEAGPLKGPMLRRT